MRSKNFTVLVLLLTLTFSPFLVFADVSNISATSTLSTGFACTSSQSGNYKGYQYLGQGLSGKLTQVDIKIKNPGPVFYGKYVIMAIRESDVYLDNYNLIASSHAVWKQGLDNPLTRKSINNFDGVVSFNTPEVGLDYDFLPLKHYYLVPVFGTIDGGGICQNSFLYGSTNPDSYPTGEFFGDSILKDAYFNLKGLTYTPPFTGNSSVLFVPGLEASRLYQEIAGGGEKQLWEPNGNSDLESLYLNEDGTSINPNIYTRDIIKETNVPFPTGIAGQNIYKSFAGMMDEMVADGDIKRWESFSYDWRQGVQDIVDNGAEYFDGTIKLTDLLQVLVDSSLSGKVTIVSHSNGGLVAKAFLKKLQDDKIAGRNNLIDKVDVLILVAVPEIGTASALSAVLHGFDHRIFGGLLMNEAHARELAKNMPGAMGLLPSKEYIEHVSNSPVTFVEDLGSGGVTNSFFQNYGLAINSYAEYKDFLFGNEGRVSPGFSQTNLPVKISAPLFSVAENLHNVLDSWVPPESLRVIEVAGWGLDTIAGFEYYPKFVCDSSSGAGVNSCTTVLDERPKFTIDGDKTVVVPSAHYMSFQGNAEKYWVNIVRYNRFFNFNVKREHKDILEIDGLNNLIKSVINKNEITLDDVIKNVEPTDNENHFRISVHSPVTLDAYDKDGNHTGKICSETSDFCYIEENIMNSSYLEFGEGKYINLPEEGLSKVKLQGTDVGTFTYESEKVLPDGTSITDSFVDIPVTSQTQVEIVVDQNGTLEMKLDVTGDGIVDFNLAPNQDFDPVIYLQILKKTIDSLDLTPAKIKAFDKRVDSIITSIQKGKVDKAKIKADRFKKVLENRISKPEPKRVKAHKLTKTDAQLLLDMVNKLLDNIS